MLYEKYEKKINRNILIQNQLYKYRILLFTLAAIVFISLSGYSFTKGIVYDVSIPESFEYSEDVEFKSEALFSKVTYSYREKGTTEWVEDKPTTAGEYEVEIKANQVFGGVNKKVLNFTIKPKNISLNVNNQNVVFGETPTINTDLSDGDYIDDIVFNYESISQTESIATIESITIKDSLGNDVTSSYDFTGEEYTINFTPREITLSLLDISDLYKGIPLTSDEIEITSGSLPLGHTVTVTSSGIQLNVGDSLNSIVTSTFYSDGIDVSANYSVTYIDGSLELTQRPITIESASDTLVYDATTLTNETFSVIEGSIIDGHTITVLTNTGQTNVGSSDNILTYEIRDLEGNLVTNNYDITNVYGELTVSKQSITITSSSDTKVYDGTSLSNNTIQLTTGSLADGHSITVLNNSSITDVSSAPNTVQIVIEDSDSIDVTANYDISFVYGLLEITKKPITITTNSESKEYDQTSLSHMLYTVSPSSLIDTHSIVVSSHTEILNVSSINNVLSIQINDALNNDVTTNYDITYIYGTLEITKRPITVKPLDASKVYDGTTLISENAVVTIGSLINGHSISITTDGSIIDVSNTQNNITNSIITSNGNDVSRNYDITYVQGSLEITQRPITVTLSDQTKVYDGLYLESEDSSVTSGTLIDTHTVKVTSVGNQLNVGTSDNLLTDVEINSGDTDVTSNYLITYVNGSLTVTPQHITVKPVDTSKVYDGTDLQSIDVECTTDNLILGHTLTATTLGSQLNAGVSDNTVQSITVYQGLVDVSSNYNITYLVGSLEVTKRPITIKPVDAVRVYDALALTSSDLEIVTGSLVSTEIITGITNGSITHVGVNTNIITSVEFLIGGVDYSSNYEITYNPGTLEITKRAITFVPVDVTKMYDGIPLTSTLLDITSGNLVGGDNASATTLGTITNTGTVVNTIDTVQIMNGLLDVTNDYLITIQDGTLEVTKRPIVLDVVDQSKVYDGLSLTSTVVESIGVNNIVAGHVVNAITLGNQLNVGISNNIIQSVELYDGAINVTSNYSIIYEGGTLEVTRRPITINPTNQTRVYDGTEFTSTVVSVTVGNLVLDHSLSITSSGSIINVGTTLNTVLTATILDSTSDVTSNYLITYDTGTLEITKRPITLESTTDTKVYDSTPLINDLFTVTDGSVAPLQTINVLSSSSITNVGTTTNALTIEILDSLNNDVIDNYEVTYVFNELEVTKRPITITTETDSKEYDGEVFSNQNYIVSEDSLIPSQTINLLTYTEITDASIVENTFTIEILDSLSNDVTSNYQVTYENGTLEITKRAVTVLTDSGSKIYDGELLNAINFSVDSGSLVIGHTTNITEYTDIINVSVVDNKLLILVFDTLANDVSSNYEITYLYGTLEITPRQITIETATDSKIYDGELLYNTTLNVIVGTIPLIHSTNVLNYTSIINASTENNIIDVEILDSNSQVVTSNYEITYTYGSLEITKREITLDAVNQTKIYDGTPLTSTEVTSVGLLDIVASHTALATTSGSQLNVGVDTNSILTVQILDGTIDVTNNYQITLEEGVLEVTKRPITIESGTDTKIYDGTPLTTLETTVTEGSLVDTEIINVLTSTELTIVDVVDNVITVSILNSSNEDVTNNYDITYTLGFLEVTPRTIIISTVSDTKLYDGTPLTNPLYEQTEGSVVLDHQLNVTVTGTITEIGIVFNTFTYEIVDSNLVDMSSYYIIVENTGTLEVEREKTLLIIQTGSDSKIYDGTPLTLDEFTLYEGTIQPGHRLEVVVTGTITEVGTELNVFTYTVYDASDLDVTLTYYDIQSEPGELTILQNDQNGGNTEEGSPISNEGELGDTVPYPVLEIYSETNDTVYLRDKSYGDYNKTGWNIPVVYESLFGTSPFEFPTLAADNSVTSYQIQVRALMSGLSYYVPYYPTSGLYDNLNDVYVDHSYGDQYTIDYVPTSSLDYTSLLITDAPFQGYESDYRTYVYNNYLDLPRETEEALLRIAAENGLVSTNASIISDVQNYIQNAGVYNLAYKPIPENVDVALYFLEQSHEGICQHFATAGVVMYRAMGIPARYVTGYYADTVADQWTEVTNMQAHAWVEIYIDGFGWVPVEVTGFGEGTGAGTGTGSGEGSGSGETPDENLIPLEIISLNDSKIYDGTPLTNSINYYNGTLLPGHTLTVDVTGSVVLVGEAENIFTYTITNDLGEDVSGLYNVTSNYGALVIAPNNDLEILELQLFDISTVYTGEDITHTSLDYWIPSFNLPANYTVTFDVIGSIKEVGKITAHIDQSSVVILDENQMDVTNQYNIITYEGSIQVTKRNITVTSSSATKDYDGTPLTYDVYYISQGTLATTDSITVVITGTVTEPNIEPNTIDSIIILDSNSIDVTDNYNITEVLGELTVNPE